MILLVKNINLLLADFFSLYVYVCVRFLYILTTQKLEILTLIIIIICTNDGLVYRRIHVSLGPSV